jgi:acid stress chaperone HdeA
VVDGDDLFAISERLQIPADPPKTHNKLASNEVKAEQKLAIGPAGGSAAGAAHRPATHKAVAKKPLAKMTCEDFVGLDESFQPKAVYWAVAYGKGGQPEAKAVDVEGVESIVPVVVEECKKAPRNLSGRISRSSSRRWSRSFRISDRGAQGFQAGARPCFRATGTSANERRSRRCNSRE